ncbi:MAG TPA: biotin/lipoyl-containing protein [Candidatus Thermoplasmatota archaeon]|nr:biotin/lipoyl-containing protein [Candidatus Thermoplasmatota archaeon]
MHVTLTVDGKTFDLYVAKTADVVKVEVDGEIFEVRTEPFQGGVKATVGGQTFVIGADGDRIAVDGRAAEVRVEDFRPGGVPGNHAAGAGGKRGGRVKPPMPGKIVAIKVAAGDAIKAGQVVAVLEAMKMQNEIPSPVEGVVKEIHVKLGQSVESKDIIATIE